MRLAIAVHKSIRAIADAAGEVAAQIFHHPAVAPVLIGIAAMMALPPWPHPAAARCIDEFLAHPAGGTIIVKGLRIMPVGLHAMRFGARMRGLRHRRTAHQQCQRAPGHSGIEPNPHDAISFSPDCSNMAQSLLPGVRKSAASTNG